jgi:hypothetical protein
LRCRGKTDLLVAKKWLSAIFQHLVRKEVIKTYCVHLNCHDLPSHYTAFSRYSSETVDIASEICTSDVYNWRVGRWHTDTAVLVKGR